MRAVPGPWAALASASGRVDPWSLIDALGGVDAVSSATPERLAQAGLRLDLAARAGVASPCETRVPFVLAGEEDYPRALQLLPFAPPVLFSDGALGALGPPGIAIVGARRCTADGRRTAAELARAVCLAGGVVISGMAMGIDTAAHREAMAVGVTAAVLGQGLTAPMSTGAQRLRGNIVQSGGVVLSEFLPDVPARRFTFLQRNRVIAGLARATVVVEAGHRSGALNTARHALEAGREVLAVPGGHRSECSQGCLTLIEQGATMVRTPATVLAAAGLEGGLTLTPEGADAPESLQLMNVLRRGGTVESLSTASGQPMVKVLTVLAELEAVGLVRRLPGQRFQLLSG